MALERPERPHHDPGMGRLLALGTVTIGLLSGLGLLGGLDWRLDLLAHFRVQAMFGSMVLVMVAMLARRWRWAAVAGGLSVVHLAGFVAGAGARAADGPRLELLHFNVLSSNARYADVVAWISASAADVVFVQEVSPRWAAELSAVPGYRLVEAVPRTDNFGLAALVREGLDVETESAAPVRELPVLVLKMRHAGRELALLSVHTLPPMTEEYAATRDAQLAFAATWARERRDAGVAPVVIGDFNATAYSAGMAPLRATAFMRDASAGFRAVVGTWPASPWPLRIAIDHCWHADTLVVVDRAVGPELGSDHLPLRVSLAWAD